MARKLPPAPNVQPEAGITNFYTRLPAKLIHKPDNPNFASHLIEIPFRMVVCAPSGSGKANLILNVITLFSRGKGTFSTISVCTRNQNEPLYRYLEEAAPGISVTEGLKSLPVLDNFDEKQSHLVIIDDLVLSKDQSRVCDYYIRCRKLGVSVVYLSQSFFLTPKIVRNNCNYMAILKLSGQREVNVILSEFGLGVTKEELLAIYKKATETKLVPMIVDLEATPERRFRRGFTEILDPADF